MPTGNLNFLKCNLKIQILFIFFIVKFSDFFGNFSSQICKLVNFQTQNCETWTLEFEYLQIQNLELLKFEIEYLQSQHFETFISEIRKFTNPNLEIIKTKYKTIVYIQMMHVQRGFDIIDLYMYNSTTP